MNMNSCCLLRDISRKFTASENHGVNLSGLLRQPKWGHLRDLHRAIKQAEPVLVSGDPTIQSLGNYEKVYVAKNVPHDNGYPNTRKISADIHG
jgi:hypothetical protein